MHQGWIAIQDITEQLRRGMDCGEDDANLCDSEGCGTADECADVVALAHIIYYKIASWMSATAAACRAIVQSYFTGRFCVLVLVFHITYG